MANTAFRADAFDSAANASDKLCSVFFIATPPKIVADLG
jgi:hypothetical protein